MEAPAPKSLHCILSACSSMPCRARGWQSDSRQTCGCANLIQGSYAWEKTLVGGSSSGARNLLDFLLLM